MALLICHDNGEIIQENSGLVIGILFLRYDYFTSGFDDDGSRSIERTHYFGRQLGTFNLPAHAPYDNKNKAILEEIYGCSITWVKIDHDQSKYLTEKWKTPAFREKMTRHLNDPNYRERISNIMKIVNNNPKKKRKQGQTLKKTLATPEAKKMMSERSKKLWEKRRLLYGPTGRMVKKMSDTMMGLSLVLLLTWMVDVIGLL